MRTSRRLLLQASAIVAMEAVALFVPAKAHGRAALICGGPICVTECAASDVQCDALTDGVCPHFDMCTMEPSCNILTDEVAVICTG